MTNWFLHSKFKLACAAFIAGLGLLIAHMLTSEQWVSFTTWTLGLYFGSSVADSAVAKKPLDTTP
jgi:CHASE2 domain-containing sensor protein